MYSVILALFAILALPAFLIILFVSYFSQKSVSVGVYGLIGSFVALGVAVYFLSNHTPTSTATTVEEIAGDIEIADYNNAAAQVEYYGNEYTYDYSPNHEGVTVEEQLLYDQNGIKITLKSLDPSGYIGPDFKVLIENDGDRSVMVFVRDASVNGIMIDPIIACEIDPGKKSNDSISFSWTDLEMAGIEKIKDVELRFSFSNSKTYETLFESDVIAFSTSATDYVQQYDNSGTLLLNDEGIQVVVKDLSSDGVWGTDVLLYIENNRDEDVSIFLQNVSVNGYMVSPLFACDIAAGKKAYDAISFSESELTENDITDIEELELIVSVQKRESYDVLFESEKIILNF